MSLSLEAVLRKHAGPRAAIHLGADETEGGLPVSTPEIADRAALRADLEAVRRSNNTWFTVGVVLLVILFLATLWIVIAYIDRPTLVRSAISILGISSAGLVTLMFRMWGSKSRTEYVLILVSNMDAATLKSIVDILARKL
jgi:hypothetical protein